LPSWIKVTLSGFTDGTCNDCDEWVARAIGHTINAKNCRDFVTEDGWHCEWTTTYWGDCGYQLGVTLECDESEDPALYYLLVRLWLDIYPAVQYVEWEKYFNHRNPCEELVNESVPYYDDTLAGACIYDGSSPAVVEWNPPF
jgi:hypothetical protein